MSTSAQISPSWKQEVNRRLSEHRDRKGASAAAPAAAPESQHNASRRAMEAAARVAARYAKVPSYSEMLASEARVALRAAEAASEAALQAKAAAQSVLAGLEAAHAPRVPELAAAPQIAQPLLAPEMPAARESLPVARGDSAAVLEPSSSPAFDDFFNWQHSEPGPELVRAEACAAPASDFAAYTEADQPSALRWDLEPPALAQEPVEARAARGQQPFETGAENWWRPAAIEPESAESEEIEVVDPLPIHANLIEFPRELVAPHKARPRLAEGISAPQPGMQLSIFEVDPVSLATEVEQETASSPAESWNAQPWNSQATVAVPTWSGMELEAQPAAETAEAAAVDIAAPEAAPALQTAPASLRLMALVVDGALIAGSLLAAAMVAATRASALPGPRTAEIGMGVALLLVAAFYEALFFTLGSATPGMRYAHIRLSTFEGAAPDRAERCKRLGALLVSALPAGLGLAWSLFDEDHLSWHDRLSRTYLCKR